MTQVRVFIAAPTPMMRAGLRALLATDEIQVAGDAASLADLEGDLQGVDVLVLAAEQVPERELRQLVGESTPGVVVLSEGNGSARTLRDLPLRGWGIVPPDAPAEELRAAVQAASQGLVVLSVPLAEQLLGNPAALQALSTGTLEEPLTARELEVLQLLSQGDSNKLIARKLQISEHTVKFHVSSIYTKLGAVSRTDAVNRGARLGLISF